MEKKLAVIILNWNGLEYTKKSVQSLLDSTETAFDIFVLDNGSEKNEADSLQLLYKNETRVHVERSEHNRGFAAGNNHMAQLALTGTGYPYLLFLNQDATVDPDTLTQLLAYMDAHARTAVCGPIVLRENGAIESVGAKINLRNGKIRSRLHGQPIHRVPPEPLETDCVIGNCFLVRASAWQSVGGFDEDFFAYYEEADWCVRARTAGWVCAVVPSAIARHAKSGGFRTYLVTRNMIWFEKKQATPAQFLIFFVLFWLWYIPERIKKGSSVGELLRGALHGFFNLHRGQFS